ncbi:hypothetical protein OIV83_004261 [Microbotryomycetes sp. JL201]|nr:hypothetical protein OIV83_004261 [Microbotryomycetes sp. JL201]
MLPHQRQKVDISSLNDQERELFQRYGKVPSHKGLLANKLKLAVIAAMGAYSLELTRLQERKYFDSGDYAMSKAGVSPQHVVGTAIPSPADIPHASPPSNPVPISGAGGQPGTNISMSPTSSFVIGQQQQQSGSPTNVGVGHPIGSAAAFGSPSKEPIGTFGGRSQ